MINLNAENTLQAIAHKLKKLTFDGGTLLVKAKRTRYSIQIEKEDGIHTLGMLDNGEIVRDYGQMSEVVKFLNNT